MLALTTSASPPDALAAQSAAAMICRSRVSEAPPPPVDELTMSAPGATPGYVPLRPAIAPATHVGWSKVLLYASEPLVLREATTRPERSPPVWTLWYSTTATRTPAPWSPPPLVQLACTAGPALDMVVAHVRSSPRLDTSGTAASSSTRSAGKSR